VEIGLLGRVPHWFLTYGMRAVIVGKAKWKALEPSLSRKIINQSIPHSCRMAEISATIKKLNDTGS
jgi:hypothetical protein